MNVSVVIGGRVDPKLKKQLKLHARSHGRTLSRELEQAIKFYLKAHEHPPGK